MTRDMFHRRFDVPGSGALPVPPRAAPARSAPSGGARHATPVQGGL
ncbi:hypothetical protein [Rhodococcus kronopolitis]|uniref:Uncharacterized protein n=1 Tax=Rhodococcus kronopolitis TaxID=1460226 RepID=A0ABV9FU52_9NOCA